MPKKTAWDRLVEEVIEAKAAIEPLQAALHHEESMWTVEQMVAAREKRPLSDEMKSAYESALAELEQARARIVMAQARMKAGV